MKDKVCPQCKIRRFRVKDDKGNSLVVTITEDNQIVPVHPEESFEGFDLETLYCLGCSWQGTIRKLI